ncbi:NAD-dependent epimerase/dehydratase family protein [Granulicella arctica]|uniref:NAD-dependent epimerase/dehydratase family protein n=1 Tax=Granulicella arctica TaxID=940613 RepID=UPI0021E03ADE|nr:NAD-dependent epimerase/dehydratase family protein [Granulicella arctica]
MTTLITGASGFLGGRIAQLLSAQGEDIIVLARPTSALTHLANVPHRLVEGDLSDPASLQRAVTEATRIIHCAACSTDWAPWQTYYGANVTGTQNLVDAVLRSDKIERFVHISTTDVYGYPPAPCDESTLTRDAGLPYNQTKRLGELAVWKAHQDHGLPVTILRPATIYGPRGKDFTVEIATLLRQRLMATIDHGGAPGGFAYVDNVAEAILQASTHPATIGEAFNLADGTEANWATYLKLYAEALGTKPPWINLSLTAATALARILELPHRLLRLPGRPLLTRHAVLLLALNQEFPAVKAKETFGFSPKVSLEEGIARSAAWLSDKTNV